VRGKGEVWGQWEDPGYPSLCTDEDGLPIPAEKSDEDGRYHLHGDLQLAPPSAFKNTIKLVDIIISNTGEAKIVLTVPLPRYATAACCDDTSHVSNRLDPEFLRNYPDPKSFCLRPPQQAKGQQRPEFSTYWNFLARSSLTRRN
jgi:hypothetical protein